MNRLTKALSGIGTARKAARGTLSGYTIGVSPQWGQPLPQVAASDASGLITPQRMREVVLKTATAAATMNSVLDYAGGVKLSIRNVDPAKPVPAKQLAIVKRILSDPNPTQTRRQFMLSLMRDLFTLGFAAIEIDGSGPNVNLWVMDASRLRIDFDEHGTVLGYDMLDARGIPIIRGQSHSDPTPNYDLPRGAAIGTQSADIRQTSPGRDHGWEPEEVIFFSLNPMSESVYPYSRISQLFSAAIIEDLMMYFISQRFTDSNIPFGVMDLGDVTEQELKVAISNWNAQANEQHHILLTGSKSGSKWIPFGYHLKDLEATELLKEVRMKIMGIVGVTMNELGESQDINKSNGYNLSFTFKKRAIEPTLNEITETLTRRLLWEVLGFHDLEMYYDEIDSRDDMVMAQIDDAYLKMGVLSINDVRNRKGLPNIPGGDTNYVFTGSAWIPVSLLQKMSQVMVQAEQAGAQGVSVTGPNGANSVREHLDSNQPASSTAKPSQGGKSEGKVHAARQVTGSKNR